MRTGAVSVGDATVSVRNFNRRKRWIGPSPTSADQPLGKSRSSRPHPPSARQPLSISRRSHLLFFRFPSRFRQPQPAAPPQLLLRSLVLWPAAKELQGSLAVPGSGVRACPVGSLPRPPGTKGTKVPTHGCRVRLFSFHLLHREYKNRLPALNVSTPLVLAPMLE